MKHIIFAISIFLHLLAVGQNNFRLNKNAKITQHSLSENEESGDLTKALKIFKRYAKKMAKNLKRFSH